MPVIRDIILASMVTSFQGFSSGVPPNEYAVNLSTLIKIGIMRGNARTAVKDAFCWVLIAMEEIKVNKTDNPTHAITPVTKNHSGFPK